MSGKSSILANAVLNCIFLGEALAHVFDNAASAPATEIWMSLHSADPGPSGNQLTSEIAYLSYARVSVSRDGSGFTTSTAGSTSPIASIIWPISTGFGGTAAFWGIGLASAGAGELLYSGPITPAISCGTGVEPELTPLSTIEES